MSDTVIVRELTDADKAEALTDYTGPYPDDPDIQGQPETAREKSERIVGSMFANPNSQIWKASVEGDVGSYMYIVSTYYSEAPDSEVLLSHWDGGADSDILWGELDRALFDQAMESAKAKKIAQMWIGIGLANGDAAKTLTKNGFRICESSTVPESLKSKIGDLKPFMREVR